MSRYSTYGSLDNRIEKEGDVGFIGFNNRLRPDQLQAGMLADSQNMRMDSNGQAQVRKGIDLISSPLTVGSSALTLPFYLIKPDDSSVTVTVNGNGAVEISNLSASLFPNSGTVNISGVTGSVSPDINGDRAFTKNSDTQITIADQVYSGTPAGTATVKFAIINDDSVNAIYGACAFSDPNKETSQHIVFAANSKALAINVNTKVVTEINYPDGVLLSQNASMLQAFNKVFIFRNGKTALENKLKISNIFSASLDGSSNQVVVTTRTNHNLIAGEKVTIRNLGGSDLNPNPNGTFTISALGGLDGSNSSTTFRYALNGNNATYTVTLNPVVVTEFTKVSSGEYTQPVTIVSDSCDIKNNQCTATVSGGHSLKIGDIIFCTVQGDSTLITNQFTQISTINSFSTLPEQYTILSIGDFSLSTGAIGRVGSTTTVQVQFSGFDLVNTGNLKVGDRVTISGATYNGTGGSSAVNTRQVITEITTVGGVSNDTLKFVVSGLDDAVSGGGITASNLDSFTFNVVNSIADKANSAIGTKPQFIRKVSSGVGFTHMPSPPYAVYHQRRLAMPFNFSTTTVADSFKSRGVLDEIIFSDILDTNTYDQIFAQFRFNAGEADFNIGLHSFAEDTLLVFNRNSIHLVQGTTDLEKSNSVLLTNEVGCVARKSIQQIGSQVLFLSDNGVYGTKFLDEYNLRGTETPLSEPINTTINKINKDAQQNAVSAYFDNRYFLAVPLDFVDENGQTVSASQNNAIIIYNFLNKQWESVDTVGNTKFHITDLFVVGEGADRGVYAVNDLGGIHRLNSRNDSKDVIITQIGALQSAPTIPASMTTRQYTVNALDRKQWRDFDIHVQSSDTNKSDFDISIETENPDFIDILGKLSTYNLPKEDGETSIDGQLDIGEDVSIRGRIGNRRGYGIQFTLNNTVGRPIIRAIEVEGSTTMRSIDKAI